MPAPARPGPVAAKMVKWAVFTVGLVGATATGDVVSLLVSDQPVTVAGLFGRGELFMVSIGLLMAASADLVFDRMLRGGTRIYHAVVLGACSLMVLPAAVAYGGAKGAELTSFALAEQRAEMSLWMFLAAVLISGVAVFLSETGGQSAAE